MKEDIKFATLVFVGFFVGIVGMATAFGLAVKIFDFLTAGI